MKSFIILAAMGLSFGTNAPTNSTSAEKHNVVVSFTRKLEFNDLVKIKLDLGDAGISLNFQKLVFNEYGKLSEISFSVDCHDGFGGAGNSGANEVTNEPFGFYRDYEDEKTPFGTGDISHYVENHDQPKKK